MSEGMATALVVIDRQKAFLAGRDAGYPWADPGAPARRAGHLGFDTVVVGDAVIRFQKSLCDGRVMPPGDVLAMTLANLSGAFAEIALTKDVLRGVGG